MSLVSGVLETLLAFDSGLLRYRVLRHCSHKTVKRDRDFSAPLYCLCSTFSRLWPIHPSTYDDGDGYAGGVGLAGGGYGSVVPTGVGVGGTGVGCVTVTDGASVVAVGCTAGGVCGGGVWVTTIMAGVRVGVGVGVLDMHPPDVSVNTTRVSSIPASNALGVEVFSAEWCLIGFLPPSRSQTGDQYSIHLGISQRRALISLSIGPIPDWLRCCCQLWRGWSPRVVRVCPNKVLNHREYPDSHSRVQSLATLLWAIWRQDSGESKIGRLSS